MNLFALIGFALAGYSVIANDSVQTLGTWITSNREKFKWYVLWAASALVLAGTLFFSWYTTGGDISFGRLTKIPFQEVQWYHALAPLALIVLTRKGIPVSTSFLVLSAFASSFVLEKMLMKSIVGYGVAAVAAYIIWIILSKFLNEKNDVKESNKPYWRTAQWLTTGFLWYTWLAHDIANIAVYLPRELSLGGLGLVIAFFVAILGWIFYEHGGKIQKILIDKQNTRYVRSATIIDLVYAFVLLYFKEMNSIPMSTTWVFVGLLSGREIALRNGFSSTGKLKEVFPMVAKDFAKLLVGMLISVAIVLCIHYLP
jgi:hypothetical protein